MALERQGQTSSGGRESGSRFVSLAGDSPELVAFALLRYLAQLEEQAWDTKRPDFDRAWLLDAYAACLEAVRGERTPGTQSGPTPHVSGDDAAAKRAGRSGARGAAR